MLKRKSKEEELSDEIIAELIEELTIKLRTQAYHAGWPPNICSVLEVRADEDRNVYIWCPAEVAKEVDDLEYGGEHGRPHALLRPFVKRAEKYIQDKLKHEWMADILNMVGVI